MRYDAMAREHGVVFNGIQHGLKGKQFPLFTHKIYGTFAMMPGETLEDSIRRKQIQFNNAGSTMNNEKKIKVQISRDDRISGGFAAYLAPSLTREGTAQVLLNIEATFHAAAANDEDPVHFIIENVMHEVGHALQEFFGKEFSEEEVEKIVEQYRQKYLPPQIFEPLFSREEVLTVYGEYRRSRKKKSGWGLGTFLDEFAALRSCPIKGEQ